MHNQRSRVWSAVLADESQYFRHRRVCLHIRRRGKYKRWRTQIRHQPTWSFHKNGKCLIKLECTGIIFHLLRTRFHPSWMWLGLHSFSTSIWSALVMVPGCKVVQSCKPPVDLVARERTSESFYQNLPAGMRALRDDDVLINCNPGHLLTQVGVSEPSDVRQLICASAWSLKFPNFSRRFQVRVHTWLVHSSLHSNDLQTTEKSHDFNRVSPWSSLWHRSWFSLRWSWKWACPDCCYSRSSIQALAGELDCSDVQGQIH